MGGAYNGISNAGLYLFYSGGQQLGWITSGSSDRMQIHCNAGGLYFYVNSSNQTGIASDARLKKDITAIDIRVSKEFITNITPAVFRCKNSDVYDSKSIGFIAQDVLAVAKTEAQKNIVNRWREYEDAMTKGEEPIEEYVDENDKDENGNPKKKTRKIYLGVAETKFIPEIIGCIQVMNKENEDLKSQITIQANQITQLQDKITALEDSVALLLSKF